MKLDFGSNNGKAAKPLIPDGVYDFVVPSAKFAVSENANDMIVLTVSVTDAAGKKHELKDYLGQFYIKKVKQFCRATGLESLFDKPELKASDFVNARGLCVVGIKTGEGSFRDSNVIKSYLPPGSVPERARVAAVPPPRARNFQAECDHDDTPYL